MWEPIKAFIASHDSFLITSHINPDGDAIGSEIALKVFLEQIGKSAVIVNSTETPEALLFLDPDQEILVYGTESTKGLFDRVEAAFILDVNAWEQVGSLGRGLKARSIPRAGIDHHQGADADFAYVMVSDTTAAATGLLVYEMIKALKGDVTRRIAEAIYAAIITDTGSFRFSNTDSRVLRAAAELCEAGADPFELNRKVFGSKSWAAGRLLGPVLSTLESAAGGKLAWISATREMIKTAGASYDDMDSFADLVRAVKGVELVLFFKETEEGDIKVSIRSNGKVDAFAIAKHFGGGGHTMASGVRVPGPLDRATETVVGECLKMKFLRL